MLQNYPALLGFLTEYDNFLKEFSIYHKTKLEDIMSNKLLKIEDSIAKGQELEMRLKNIEIKRAELLKSIGLDGKSFNEIIDMMPSPQQEELKNIFSSVSQSISDSDFYNKKAMSALGDKMDTLRKKKGLPTMSQKSSHILSKKI